jgi:hypothetical protein
MAAIYYRSWDDSKSRNLSRFLSQVLLDLNSVVNVGESGVWRINFPGDRKKRNNYVSTVFTRHSLR